jgi:hypothetical protein
MAVLTTKNQPRASVAVDAFPSIGRIVRNISAGLALSLPLAITWAQPAHAVLIFNFYELGGNLVVEGTGSLSLPSGPLSTSGGFGGSLFLDDEFFTGPSSPMNVYGITGPITLGLTPINTTSSSDSGIALGLAYSYGDFYLDSTYVSGSPISSSSTFSGITLASLGMPNSGILGTWTVFKPGEKSTYFGTISVQVTASSSGSPANVPGPLPILGLAAAFGFSRKLRKRIKLHKGTSDISISAVK